MNNPYHSIPTYQAIHNIANAADSLVIEYKEAGFMPDIPDVDPQEFMTFAQHERLVALAIRHVLRAKANI